MGGKHLSENNIIEYCKLNQLSLLEPFQKQQTSHTWVCLKHNKKFITNFKNIKTRKSACSQCQSDKIKNTFIKIGKQLVFKDVILFLIEKYPSSTCISTEIEYTNKFKLKIKCEKDHIFNMNFQDIRRGHWCPACSKGKTEQIVRTIFESIFNKQFPTVRPDFLKNPSTNKNLELDGYCEELKLAFEYDGRFHYEERSTKNTTAKQLKRHGSLSKTKQLDKLKEELCKIKGITLVRIPYWESDLLNFIKIELERINAIIRKK